MLLQTRETSFDNISELPDDMLGHLTWNKSASCEWQQTKQSENFLLRYL